MKRVLFFAVLTLAAPCWATIATDNTPCSNFANGSTSTVTVTCTVSVGDTVVAVGVCNGNSSRTLTVTDSGSNSYTGLTSTSNTSAAQVSAAGILSATSAATSVTFTFSGACSKAVDGAVATFRGVSAFGLTNTNTGSTANQSVSITTQDNNNAVVMGVTNSQTTTNNYTAVSGTILTQTESTGTIKALIGAAWITSATPSSTTVQTNTVASTWAAVGVELRAVQASTCSNYIAAAGAGCQ